MTDKTMTVEELETAEIYHKMREEEDRDSEDETPFTSITSEKLKEIIEAMEETAKELPKSMIVGELFKKLQGVDCSLPVYLQSIDRDFDSDFMQVMDVEVKDLNDVFHSDYDDENPITFPALCLMYE